MLTWSELGGAISGQPAFINLHDESIQPLSSNSRVKIYSVPSRIAQAAGIENDVAMPNSGTGQRRNKHEGCISPGNRFVTAANVNFGSKQGFTGVNHLCIGHKPITHRRADECDIKISGC